MQTLEAVKERRAVKHYDPNHKMSDAEMREIMSAAILSPTSFNIQNWRFVVVKDIELRKKIRAAAWDQAQVTEASMLVILCADLKASDKNPERYWRNAPEQVQNFLVPKIREFYQDEKLKRDEAMRSCGIAAQTIMLTAKAMGYDSCPMVGFDPVQVANLIKLPSDHVVAMMISIGKAIKPAWERGGQLPYDEVVIENTF